MTIRFILTNVLCNLMSNFYLGTKYYASVRNNIIASTHIKQNKALDLQDPKLTRKH